MATPPGTGFVLKIAGRTLIDRLKKLTPGGRTEQAYKEMQEEILIETAAAVARLEAALDERQLAPVAIDEREMLAVFARLHAEAMGSTTAARRKLMAAAIAGYLTPDISVEMKSRVVRAVEQLEPSDVVALRDLFAAGGSSHGNLGPASPSLVALAAAQCIVSQASTFAGTTQHTITDLGAALLSYLATWDPKESSAASSG